VVERAFILPPASRIGPIAPEDRAAAINKSAIKGTYEQIEDRESAYEKLRARAGSKGAAGSEGSGGSVASGSSGSGSSGGGSRSTALSDLLFGTTGPRGGHHEGLLDVAAKTVTRTLAGGASRSILRGVLGSILGGRSR